jgi:DNA-binding response OmpR family regulator
MPSILIIDDDQAITEMLVHHFTNKGWAASDAERASRKRAR